MDPTSTSEEIYRRRVDQFSAVERRYAARERTIMRLRVAAFLVAVAAFVLGRNSPVGLAWNIACGAAVAGFVAAVVYHEHVRRQMQRFGLLRSINQQGLARLHRDWAALPETPVAVPTQHQAVADDLDLFGHASLFQMLCAAHTPLGIETLRDWLVDGASAAEVHERQQAVRELALHLELRQTLELEGRLLVDRGRAAARFLEWAEDTPWLARRPWLLWLLRAMAVTVPLIGLAIVLNCVSLERGAIAIFVAAFLNIIASAFVGWRLHSISSGINLRYNETGRYARMFRLMYAMPEASPLLVAVKHEATQAGGGVLRCMAKLQRIVALARIRHSPMLFIFVYVPLQLVCLYDLHILCLLEAWQARFGVHARAWFRALGKLEALSSLATLAHDYPAWAMPAIDASARRFEAVELGHPLLPDGPRVVNDVELGPPGSFLLVTGSNMSGKSTLLRAIGVNAVLAQAGAPVCAKRLAMPPLALATSMRIRDSLEDGVSFYMAELLRLKQIVNQARNAGPRNGRLLLYLLDEILLGTNSKERHIAVVRVMEHLLRHDTIGAISTHDLDLATSPPLAATCCCVHFRETLHGGPTEQAMTFDYRLRPGIATTSNALKLLEIVGLGKDAAADA
jgi:hypothetical protein